MTTVGDALPSQPIVPLDDSHDRRSFHCGVEPLDRYLHAQAGQDQRRRIAACFVLHDPGTIQDRRLLHVVCVLRDR